jgi:hypothetical protein
MKAVFALVISWIVLVPEIVTTAQTVPAQAGRMSVSYVPPKNPAHQPIYEQLKEIRFLEKVQEFLSRVRLPRTLLVKLEGCDGDANASYDKDIIVVCYEYIDELWKDRARGDDRGWRHAGRRSGGPLVRHHLA